MNLLLECDMAPSKPPCWNRPPRLPGYVRHGIDSQTGEVIQTEISNGWYTDRCAVHDGRGIGPNGEGYPAAHGYDCSGCRWLPSESEV